MFISQKKYDALIERIERLEKSVVTLESQSKLAVWPDTFLRFHHKPTYIPLDEAVRKIMNHLGLETQYNRGTSDRVDIVPIAKQNGKFSFTVTPDPYKL